MIYRLAGSPTFYIFKNRWSTGEGRYDLSQKAAAASISSASSQSTSLFLARKQREGPVSTVHIGRIPVSSSQLEKSSPDAVAHKRRPPRWRPEASLEAACATGFVSLLRELLGVWGNVRDRAAARRASSLPRSVPDISARPVQGVTAEKPADLSGRSRNSSAFAPTSTKRAW